MEVGGGVKGTRGGEFGVRNGDFGVKNGDFEVGVFGGVGLGLVWGLRVWG